MASRDPSTGTAAILVSPDEKLAAKVRDRLAADLPVCADLDRYDVVPVLNEGSLVPLGG